MITEVDICKPNDENPSMPCATGDKSSRDKQGRTIEKLKFLTRRHTYSAYPRKGGKARPCCQNWSWKKNLKIFMDSPHYENVPMQNYCEKQRQKVLNDGKYAYPEINSGSAKKEFLAVCIWTRLLELEPEVAKRYILGSGHGAVCPLYFLGKMNPSTFAELPKEKSHRIPVCIYALNKDPIWFMNSPLQQDGCGRKFHIIAHYQVWSHENESIAKRYRRQGSADTDICLWSKPAECKTSAPKFPCQKNPKKWPADIDKIRQRKLYAIHYLNEKPKYAERNSNRAGCCTVSNFSIMLRREATRHWITTKKGGNAFSCKRVAQIQAKKTGKKYSLFESKKIWDWFGFCVASKLIKSGKEQAMKDKLLSYKTNDRMCVIRVFDKSQYGDFSQKAVWCAFVKIYFRKDFEKAFGKYCKSPGSDPWPAGLKAKEANKKTSSAKKQAKKTEKVEKEEKPAEKSSPKPKSMLTTGPQQCLQQCQQKCQKQAAPSTPKKAKSSGSSSGRSSRRGGRRSGKSSTKSRRGGRSRG